jgi:hypothetical protein
VMKRQTPIEASADRGHQVFQFNLEVQFAN